mgnify:CR=1 FL=1
MSQLNANTTKPCKFQGVYKIWLGDQGAKRFVGLGDVTNTGSTFDIT